MAFGRTDAQPGGLCRRPVNSAPIHPTRTNWRDLLLTVARWAIGASFIYMGLVKAMHPADFLKLVRQYHLAENPLLLNLIAGGLPWFEVFCGLLLVAGVAVRGTALVVAGLLVPFTIVIFNRALDIQSGSDLPFCAIKFNCGCGSGEANVCAKLLANTIMTITALVLVARREHRWRLWPR